MIKQILLPIAAVAAFIIVVGLFIKNAQNIKLPAITSPQEETLRLPDKTVTINEIKITVEIANTQEKRAQGLGGRSSLDEYSGMLFVFDTQNITPIFWMKGMLIPIDIIWIDDGRIVKIDKSVEIPAKDTPDDRLTTYSPGQPIDYVLEVSSGFSDRRGFKVGDTVDLSKI